MSHKSADVSLVSIHAPVKGATRPETGRQRHDRFNPRAREGRDGTYTVAEAAVDEVSIHAPVKGATGDGYWIALVAGWFQSTRP